MNITRSLASSFFVVAAGVLSFLSQTDPADAAFILTVDTCRTESGILCSGGENYPLVVDTTVTVVPVGPGIADLTFDLTIRDLGASLHPGDRLGIVFNLPDDLAGGLRASEGVITFCPPGGVDGTPCGDDGNPHGNGLLLEAAVTGNDGSALLATASFTFLHGTAGLTRELVTYQTFGAQLQWVPELQSVPEPASLALFAPGLAGFCWMARRRKQAG